MERDNFKRYKKSNLFSDFLRKTRPYKQTNKLKKSSSSMALTESINQHVSIFNIIRDGINTNNHYSTAFHALVITF